MRVVGTTARLLGSIIVGALLAHTVQVSAQRDQTLARRVTLLSRDTPWKPVGAIKIGFDTFHPQGMVKIGSDIFLSSVEVRTAPRKLAIPGDGQAYDTGVGVGHLFKIGPGGELLADLILGEGPIYHPGGIDFDGTAIWVPVSEYRPDSRAIIYKVTPETMAATVFMRVADHIGGVVHDLDGRQIVGISWGSRRFYTWPDAPVGDAVQGPIAAPVANPESYVDYQDCHGVGARQMLCAGTAEYRQAPGAAPFQLGGIDLIDLESCRDACSAMGTLGPPDDAESLLGGADIVRATGVFHTR